MAANCDERVEQRDFDEAVERLSTKLEQGAAGGQVDNVSRGDGETRIEESLPESILPMDTATRGEPIPIPKES